MMLGPKYPTGYYNCREDFEKLDDADDVIAKVQRDRNAIGFILHEGEPPSGVKVVPVMATPDASVVALKEGKFIQPEYPLAEWLVLYLRPDASPQARAFFEFATSEAGAKIAAKPRRPVQMLRKNRAARCVRPPKRAQRAAVQTYPFLSRPVLV